MPIVYFAQIGRSRQAERFLRTVTQHVKAPQCFFEDILGGCADKSICGPHDAR